MSTTAADFPTTLRRLSLEWNIALDGSPSGSEAWQADSCLARYTPAELAAGHFSLPRPERDAVLAALVRAARTDWLCELAVFVLLHRSVVVRVSGARTLRGETDFARDALVLSAMHSAIRRRSFPEGCRIFSTLVLNTLHELTVLGASAVNALANEVPHGDPVGLLADDAASDSTDPASEITELLAWAADSRALTSYQVRLLARIHLGGMTLQSVADEDGVTKRTITTRCAEARGALRKAVQSHITVWGSWA